MRIAVGAHISFWMARVAEETTAANGELAVVLTRTDNLPIEVHATPDPYFEGYIQALVDIHYAEYGVVVLVKDHTVWLANLPRNRLIANSIIAFVKDIPGVCSVEIDRRSDLQRGNSARQVCGKAENDGHLVSADDGTFPAPDRRSKTNELHRGLAQRRSGVRKQVYRVLIWR